MTIDAPRELRIRADDLAANDHSTIGATATHHLVGGQLWRTFRALGYTDGVVLGAGDGAVPMVGIPEMDQASEDSVVADLDSQHRPRRPVQDLEAWPGGEYFDIVITALAGYDERLTYQPNIVRRRADQLEAALMAVYFTRPGGLTALVATHDLMDNPIPFGRRHLADMADLVGAVRMPAGTYRQTAGPMRSPTCSCSAAGPRTRVGVGRNSRTRPASTSTGRWSPSTPTSTPTSTRSSGSSPTTPQGSRRRTSPSPARPTRSAQRWPTPWTTSSPPGNATTSR